MLGPRKRTAAQAGLGQIGQQESMEIATPSGSSEEDIFAFKPVDELSLLIGKARYNRLTRKTAPHPQSSPTTSTLMSSRANIPPSFLAKHGTQMVDIYVGKEKQLFRIYKDLLCNKIEFFDKMFNGNFKEATENTAILPEDDPEAFDMLMCWAAYGTIRSLRHENFQKTLNLWILVEKLCLGSLQDHVMDMWRNNDKLEDKYYKAEELQYIFDKTPSKSPPRQYAARMLRYQSLKPPAMHREYSRDLHGIQIPLSNMNVIALSKLLAKNEDMLEEYLKVADRAQIANVDEMDPRATPFSCKFHHHPDSLSPCPSNGMGGLAFKYLDAN
ncbi:hypothetical protein EAF04_007155 [Stromatinia cepivora]|nr:hypothetical protein EAF04_007155 [Stromatinia cepivora]